MKQTILLLVLGCKGRTIDYRLSTIDYRLSTIDYRLSTIDYRLSTIDCRLSNDDAGVARGTILQEIRPGSLVAKPAMSLNKGWGV